MSSATDQDLMRLLHGELPEAEARALRARVFRDPELTAAYRRLERAWQRLELPPAAAAPVGFAGRLIARARAQPQRLSWGNAPLWARAAAAVALVAGALLGAGVGRLVPRPASETAAEAEDLFGAEPSFADSYWQAVGEPTPEPTEVAP
jgi:anti-sigma factor RsiW